MNATALAGCALIAGIQVSIAIPWRIASWLVRLIRRNIQTAAMPKLQHRRCINTIFLLESQTIAGFFGLWPTEDAGPQLAQAWRGEVQTPASAQAMVMTNSESGADRGQAMAEVYARQADTGEGDKSWHIHPPLLAAVLLLGGLLLHLASGHRGAFPFRQFVGLLLVASGAGLSSYAAALFAARDTTRNPYGEPATFITASPYTFTRNPMYVGLTTALLGLALFFGSPVMVLAPIVFAVVIDQMVIPQEERTMERLYGEHYCDYKQRVPRWLPFLSFTR